MAHNTENAILFGINVEHLMATKTTANGFYSQWTVNSEHWAAEHAFAAHLLAFEPKVVFFPFGLLVPFGFGFLCFIFAA